MSVFYHEGRDQCFYYSSNGQWKSAPTADFPDHTWYVLYRSGKLQVPDWPQLGYSLMTLTPSSPPPLSPHVSFPQSAFRPVIPAQDTCTDQLQQQTPLQPSFNPNQLPPPTFALGLLPTTPHMQNQITPRVLWPHSLNSAFYNLPPYEEYPYQNFSSHTFVPQNTTQSKTFQIPSTQMSQTTNAMTQTAEPVQQSARPSHEQQVEIDQQTPNRTLQWPTRELQMEIDRQLAIHLQEMEAARARAQSYDGTSVELTNVRSTNHTQTIENQASHPKANRSQRSRAVEIQTQTDIPTRPKAQTDAYDTLLNKANDERMKKSKQEKGIQAETLDFPPEVQQPNCHVMVNHHQQIAEIPHKYSNSREYRPARNPNYVNQYSRTR